MQVLNDNFLAIQEHISSKLINIATIDLWNEQPSFDQEELPIITPAVYVEYSPITWNRITDARHGTGTLTLHLIRDNVSDSYTIKGDESPNKTTALLRFATMQALQYIMEGWRHATCKPLELIGTSTDHNHDGLIHDTSTYKLCLVDCNLYNTNDTYTTNAVLPPFDVQANTLQEPPCTDTECPNGRGISFVRVAGWDITTNGLDIFINDITLQVATNSQFSNASDLISIWNTGYVLESNGVLLTQSSNKITASAILDPQMFSLIIQNATNELARTTFGVVMINAIFQPYMLPLQRPALLLQYDLRCTNPSTANIILPYNYYFPGGDGTMSITSTSIESNTSGIYYQELDTQAHEFNLESLALNEIDENTIYIVSDYADPDFGKSYTITEVISNMAVACLP
jgi:hypothetical protein